MKKLITLLLVVITVFILTIGASAKTVLKGDLNLDGRITAADARGTLRISAKLDEADDAQKLIVDVTNDSKITASDARSILRAAAKLEDAFGEIEIGGNTETETTTVADKETTTVSGPKTELSSLIGKESDSIIKEFDSMHKVGTSDGTLKYTNGKVTLVSDPSIIKDKKISSIIIHDSAYLLDGVSVDMTPGKATDTLKKADWIITAQNSNKIILKKNLMQIIISVTDEKITSIEYVFAESLLSPDETTTAPVTEHTTLPDAEITTQLPEDGKHEHSYMKAILAPTCTEKGYTTYTCLYCGDKYTADETEPKGHDYVSVAVKPTCTENGFTKNTCSRCDDMYASDTIAATGHKATWVTVITPAPGIEGLDQYKCRTCSAVLNEATRPALPLPEEPTTKEPVTEEPTTEPPEAGHTHNYEVTVVPPSCEENGYTKFTCSECSDTYNTDIVPSTGHNAFWQITIPAEIEKDGLKEYKCRYCDTVLQQEKIPALKAEEQEKPEGELTVDDLPKQIKAFISGNFGVEGYNYSGNTKAPISMYISPEHLKAGMDLNGMKINMLIRDVQTNKASVYLIRPDTKKYAKLESWDMAALGITVNDLKLDFGGGTAKPDSIIYSTQTLSGVNYDIYTIYTGSEYCKIYMVGEDIKRIETFETATKMLKTRIDVTTFIAEPSANTFSVSGYKNVLSYLFLFS